MRPGRIPRSLCRCLSCHRLGQIDNGYERVSEESVRNNCLTSDPTSNPASDHPTSDNSSTLRGFDKREEMPEEVRKCQEVQQEKCLQEKVQQDLRAMLIMASLHPLENG